jgi:hypothetical protein
MTFSTKLAIVLLCAAICAASLSLLPRANSATHLRHDHATPIRFQEQQRSDWLLV